jgi:predicted membrane channel-forming protein YqfA (hemolysin III family)
MNKECVTHNDTPELFCEPYIHSGFRPINRPFGYYVKSLFKKHNETTNSMSHYLAALYCLSYFFYYDFTNPYTWPFLTTILTAIFMFISSASAHLMHQKSHRCHMTCFLFDFAGISLHLYSAALIQTYYCSPTWYYDLMKSSYMPILACLSIMCCLCNCFAQVNYKRPYPPIKRIIQFAPLAICWSFTIIPLGLLYFAGGEDIIIDFQSHVYHIVLFLMGGMFFGLDVPQRFFPGKFDFFGQGHHLFHICIFFVVKIQIEACYSVYISNYNHIVNTRSVPTLQMCFISVFVLFIYNLFIINNLRNLIAHNFNDKGNLISKKVEDQIDMDGLDLL